jgi:glutathione peroxidase
MSTQRSLCKSVAAALLAAVLTVPALAAPRLDALIEAHRAGAAPTIHDLLRTTPSVHPDGALAVPAPPALVHVAASAVSPEACPALLRHSFTPVQGGPAQSLCQHQGKVVLIVNTASKCGYTYQYEGLEALYRKYRDRGLVVLGFPSDDFGGQEPGSNKEIAEFCRTVYGVQFPMFEKQRVAGPAANPLYAELAAKTGQKPQWNFHKYLIDRTGTHVASFGSSVEPGHRDLVSRIERLLAEKSPASRS